MVEMRWVNRTLEFRTRALEEIDGQEGCYRIGEWGEWQKTKQRREMPPFVKASRQVIAAFEEHGVGPEFPELQLAIESMQDAFEGSVWERIDVS